VWSRGHHPGAGERGGKGDGGAHRQDAAAARIEPNPLGCVVTGRVVDVLAEQPTNPRRYLPPANT
jgi:hypothetical protein